MKAAPRQASNLVPAIEVFALRCEARAILVAEGALDFHQAINGLQAAAVAYGLVREIGQDEVQRVMADAFRGVPR